jgi:hypothetical protein
LYLHHLNICLCFAILSFYLAGVSSDLDCENQLSALENILDYKVLWLARCISVGGGQVAEGWTLAAGRGHHPGPACPSTQQLVSLDPSFQEIIYFIY